MAFSYSSKKISSNSRYPFHDFNSFTIIGAYESVLKRWQQVTFNRKYSNNIHPLIVAVSTKLYTKETENADLIFCDPPYYNKIREEYSPQSISSLSREEYLQVFQRVADAFARKAIKKVALLLSNYDDE